MEIIGQHTETFVETLAASISSLFGQPPTAAPTGYVAQFDSIANAMGAA